MDLTKLWVSLLLTALSARTLAQTDPIYLSDGDGDRILVVQGGVIVNIFPAVPAIRAFPIAVVNTVRITGYSPGEIGGEYSLSGAPTGTTYPLLQGADMSDGTTDGVNFNYGISFTGNVWRYDRNWASGVMRFAAGDFAGIAYDPTDNTLWLSRDRDAGITHTDLNGMVLGSFITIGNLDWNLAYEAASDSLWVSGRGTSELVNYSKAGVLLQTIPVAGLVPSSFISGEFQVGPVVRILSVDATPTTVTAGLGGYAVSFDVENAGANIVNIDAVALSFADSLMADVTPEYTVTPDPTNPMAISAGATATIQFLVDVNLGATIGTITIDASVDATDSITMITASDSSADITDTWDVLACSAPFCGDCTGDMQVTILDALLAAQHSAALVTLTGTTFSNCNVFGLLEPDPMAEVSILDALALAQAAASLPVALVCC